MGEPASDPEYYYFPDEVWLIIAARLDVESITALQRSNVVPWDVFAEPTLSRTATLSPHSHASALHSYLLSCDARSVRTLRLTGCLTAAPSELFQSISLCTQLVELYCVNCILSPHRLLDIVSTSLPDLTRLEWSLLEQHTYEEQLDAAFEYRVLRNVRHMYVEVAGDIDNCNLINLVLQCCVSLEYLHVHAIDDLRWLVLDACWILDDPDRIMLCFVYTSQGFTENLEFLLRLAQQREMPLIGLRPPSAIFGNVTYHTLPALSCTYAHLNDVIASTDLAIPDEQLIFCVECCVNAQARLAQVADRPWVRRLRALTLVLLPLSQQACISRTYYVSQALSSPLSRLFEACTILTELNLSFVHFDRGTELCQLLPSKALPLLRAIALPQCGLQTTAAVNQLAASCAMLEELYVRGGGGMTACQWECPACSVHFTAMNRDSLNALRSVTSLRRLTLCCFYGLRCYRFLYECRLVCLRLYWPMRSMTCCDGRSFIAWLGPSEHLRSLTLHCTDVSLRVICRELGSAGMFGLLNLCIVSDVERSDYAQESISQLTRLLPLLETVHAHYWGEDAWEHRVTWIRLWRPGIPDEYADMEEGSFIPNAPCSPDCSMTTFIALKKPHH